MIWQNYTGWNVLMPLGKINQVTGLACRKKMKILMVKMIVLKQKQQLTMYLQIQQKLQMQIQ